MLTRKSFVFGALGVIVAGPLASCGRTGVKPKQTDKSKGKDGEAKREKTVDISGTSVTIGTVGDPYASILDEFLVPEFAKNNASAKIQRFDSPKKCSEAIAKGAINIGFYLRADELEAASQDSGAELENTASVFYYPYGIFSAKHDSVKDITEETTIAVTNNPDEADRALQVLYQEDSLTRETPEPVEGEPTEPAVENPMQPRIQNIEQKDLVGALGTSDYVILRPNDFIGAPGTPPHGSDALVLEASDSAGAFDHAGILTITPGKGEDPAIVAVRQVLKSEEFAVYLQDVHGQDLMPTS